jgi:hypothetical protein
MSLSAPDIIYSAKKWNAEVTSDKQIRWVDMGQFGGEWHESLQYRPSILDAVILDHAQSVGPSYRDACIAATGWGQDTLFGFRQTILLGRPMEAIMVAESANIRYIKGVVLATLVIEKVSKHYTW